MTRRNVLAAFSLQTLSPRQAARRRFVGSWRQAQAELRRPGRGIEHPYGKSAIGRLMYDPDGSMSAQIMADQGAYGSFFGTYEVDEREGVIVHNIEGSSQAGQLGTKQKRRFRFSSDTLTLEGDGPDGHSVSIWQRVRRR